MAAPPANVAAKYQLATQLDASGEYEKALVSIDEGLALAPKDLQLLGLKGAVLLKLHDYTGALTAYQAYLAAGAKGANRRDAEKIVTSLKDVQSTFLEISLANGSASVYLDSKTQGVFCNAAPSCRKAILPGQYKVIAERAGFEGWSDSVTVQAGQTATLPITLVEKPSPLTVRVAQAGARITVDDKPVEAPITIPAGTHQVVVSAAGHAASRHEVTAHEGQPVELDVTLAPLVPVRVEPAGAALLLDDKPVEVQGDGPLASVAIPPGGHVLVVRAAGFREQRVEVPADRPAGYQVAVQLVKEAPPPEPGKPGANVRRSAGIALVEIGGAVALGAGSVLLVNPGSFADDRTAATTILAGGVAAVLIGGIIAFTAPNEPQPRTARIAPMVGHDSIGMAVAGRF